MEPDYDSAILHTRALECSTTRTVDIQVEAVFARGSTRDFGEPRLQTGWGMVCRIPHPPPVLWVRRRSKPQGSDRRRGVRNAQVRFGPSRRLTADHSLVNLDRRHVWRTRVHGGCSRGTAQGKNSRSCEYHRRAHSRHAHQRRRSSQSPPVARCRPGLASGTPHANSLWTTYMEILVRPHIDRQALIAPPTRPCLAISRRCTSIAIFKWTEMFNPDQGGSDDDAGD
jgi:hypothetical protein